MTGVTPTSEAARRYAEASLPVFPVHSIQGGRCSCGNPACPNPGKHPRTKNGLLDATSDPLQVAWWWQDWPDANIGIRMGAASGLVVIDIDPDKGGRQTLVDLEAMNGKLPVTKTTATGGGGEHFFFRHPGIEIQSGSNVLGKGFDVRGDGGYIVAPPSNHASGGFYSWEDDGPAAQLPAWLQTKLLDRHKAKGSVDVAAVLDGVDAGERDTQLYRAACKLRWANVPREFAEKLIIEAALAAKPPFDAEIARKKVLAAYGQFQPALVDDDGETRVSLLGADHIRVEQTTGLGPVAVDFEDLEVANQKECTAIMTVRLSLIDRRSSDPYRQRINLLSGSAREQCQRDLTALYPPQDKGTWARVLIRAMSRAHEAFERVDRSIPYAEIPDAGRVPFLIAGFMPADGPTILFGAGEAGKTFLAQDIAMHVALGLPWLGRECEQRTVLIMDYETGAGPSRFREKRLMAGLEVTEEPNLIYWDAQGIPLPDQLPALRQAVERHNVGLLIVDHAGAAAGIKPEESEAALRVQRALGRLHIPSLLLAHITGEGERDPKQVLRPYGSIFWRNMARALWYVHGTQVPGSDKTTIGVYARKMNDAARPDDFGVSLFFAGESGPVRVVAGSLAASPELAALRGFHWQVAEEYADVETFTVAEAGLRFGKSPAYMRAVFSQHPELFERLETDYLATGRGNIQPWRVRADGKP